MTTEQTQNLSDFDSTNLTEEEKLLLLKRPEQDETLLPEGHDKYETPGFLVMYAESLKRVAHTIFPNATPEQLEEVQRSIVEPTFALLNDIAFHTTALVANALPPVRQEHVLQPPTRYMIDYSLSAILGLVTGAQPGLVEKGYLEAIGEDLEQWKTSIADVEIPQEGIAVEFVHANKILRGKLCYFSYLQEDGSAQVMTDIPTYWCQEYNGFVHTHSVVYWRPLSELPATEVEAANEPAESE